MDDITTTEPNDGTGSGAKGATAAKPDGKRNTAAHSAPSTRTPRRGTAKMSHRDALEILQESFWAAFRAGIACHGKRLYDNRTLILTINAGQCDQCGMWRPIDDMATRDQCQHCASIVPA